MAHLNAFSRTGMLLGTAAMEKLASSRVAVFGIGGVGSYAVEALVRAGVGKLTLVDDDYICLTNLNRQIHATTQTIGRVKVEVMRDRVLEINPVAEVKIVQAFYLPENAESFFCEPFDYVVDAIDTVTAKIDLIMRCQEKKIPVVSCMGAGNKLDPTRFEVADIFKTSVCPLAKVMRHELRARGVESLKVVYSREKPLLPQDELGEGGSGDEGSVGEPKQKTSTRRSIPGSVSFVPAVAGLILAGEVIKGLAGYQAES
jgi:tRNA A37 threonylcarbamoyladenosine dehydratase